MTRLELRGLRLVAIIGVGGAERAVPQPVEIDLDLDLGVGAGAEDSLASTVDYAAVVAEVTELVGRRHDHLLETLAAAIAERVLSDPRCRRAEVCVRKLRPPVPADLASAGARVVRTRTD